MCWLKSADCWLAVYQKHVILQSSVFSIWCSGLFWGFSSLIYVKWQQLNIYIVSNIQNGSRHTTTANKNIERNETNNLFMNLSFITKYYNRVIYKLLQWLQSFAKLIYDIILIKTSSLNVKLCNLLLIQLIPYTYVIHWSPIQAQTTQCSFMLISILLFASFMARNLITIMFRCPKRHLKIIYLTNIYVMVFNLIHIDW